VYILFFAAAEADSAGAKGATRRPGDAASLCGRGRPSHRV